MCDLVCIDQTRMGSRGWVVGYLPDSLPCPATVVSQISRGDEILPFISFFFFHCVDQLCSSIQSTFAKRVT